MDRVLSHFCGRFAPKAGRLDENPQFSEADTPSSTAASRTIRLCNGGRRFDPDYSQRVV